MTPEPAPSLADALEDTQEPTAPDSPSTDEDTESTPSVNWEERYSNLQPEYTRAAQEASQYRNLVDAARNGDPDALAYLGLETEDDTDDDDYDEDEDQPLTRAEFQNFQKEQQQAVEAKQAADQELEQDASFMEAELNKLEKEHGEFSPELWDAIVELAATRRDEQGRPAVEAAFKVIDAAADKRHEAYLKSKRAPKVEVGQAGTEKIDLADDDARVNFLAEAMEAADAE